MSDHKHSDNWRLAAQLLTVQAAKLQAQLTANLERGHRAVRRGQALVEYALIVVLVFFGIWTILLVTQGAIGNVFSNQVANLLNMTMQPYKTMNAQTFVAYVTAVASYTPPARLLVTNSGAVGPGGIPPGGGGGGCSPASCTPAPTNTAQFTPTITQTPSITPSPTGTNIQATPVDQAFNTSLQPAFTSKPANMQAVDWHNNFNNAASSYLMTGEQWQAVFYNSTNYTGTPVGPYLLPDVNFDDSSGLPSGISSLNYSVIFTSYQSGGTPGNYITFNPGVVIPMPYEVRVSGIGNADVQLDGADVPLANFGSSSMTTAAGNLGALTGPHTVSVKFNKTGAGSGKVQLALSRLTDESTTCNWNNAGTAHSAGGSWSDPGSGNYAINSICGLRLRGWIDLSLLNPTNLYLSYWEQYDLATNDTLEVGVRRYDSVDTWYWSQVHGPSSASANLNWAYHAIDLTTFGASAGYYVGQKIEIAFRQTGGKAGAVAKGWFLDDISVSNINYQAYTVDGVSPAKVINDNVESNDSAMWVNGCNWAHNTTGASNSTTSWAITPYQSTNNYCPLMLNGYVDLTGAAALSPNVPQLSFDSKLGLATSGSDYAAVQYLVIPVGTSPNVATAMNTADASWLPLTVNGGSTVVGQAGVQSPPVWTQKAINFTGTNALQGQKFYLRFVIDNTSGLPPTGALGWFIDNIKLTVPPTTLLTLPFFEPFDNLGNWLPSGFVTLPLGGRSDPALLSATANPTYGQSDNNYLELTDSIPTAGNTNLKLTFWNYWRAPNATLSVELSTDLGVTWGTTLWSHVSGSADDLQVGWEREYISLASYAGTGTPPIRIRLHFQANNQTPTDTGWFVDDLAIDNTAPSSMALTSTNDFFDNMEGSTTFTNWYNGGNWTIMSNVGHPDSTGTPTRAWQLTPSGTYPKPARASMELTTAIDLTSASLKYPTAYFWVTNQLDVSTPDKMYFETWDGTSYTTLPFPGGKTPTWVAQNLDGYVDTGGTTVTRAAETGTNLGWHREAVDLTSLKGETVHLRVRVDAVNSHLSSVGVTFDDFTVVDRGSAAILPVPFNDTFDIMDNWVTEGNWTNTVTASPATYDPWSYLPPTLTPVTPTSGSYSETSSSGPVSVTTSGWVADYWHVASGTVATWGSPAGSSVTLPANNTAKFNLNTGTDNITYNYGLDPNLPFNSGVAAWTVGGVPNNQYWLARWQRTFSVSAATTYLLRLTFQGGAQIKLNGTVQTPSLNAAPPSGLGKPFYSTTSPVGGPWANSASVRTYYYQLNLSGASNLLEVDYYQTTNTGTAQIDVSFAQQGSSAHTSTYPATYATQHRTSIILNGYLKITSGNVGYVAFDQRFSLDDAGDLIRVYYAFQDNLTWQMAIPSPGPNNTWASSGWSPIAASGGDWLPRQGFLIQYTSGHPTFNSDVWVTIKFELDTTGHASGVSTDDGWWIDNVNFFNSPTVISQSPTSTTANATTSVTAFNSAPVSFTPITNPSMSTYTYTILTPPTYGTANVSGGQLQYTLQTTGYSGPDSFTYKATDQNSNSINGTASITVDPYQIPAQRIEAENWDAGTNSGSSTYTFPSAFSSYVTSGGSGNLYRKPLAVTPNDVANGSSNSNGNRVGWNTANQWWRYTVNVTTAGSYDVWVALTEGNNGTINPIGIQIDGTSYTAVTPTWTTTSAWDNSRLVSLTSSVTLTAGTHVFRLYSGPTGNNSPDFDYIQVVPTGTKLAVSAPTLASSNAGSPNLPDAAADGNLTTWWQASSTAYPQWLYVNLGGIKTVNYVVIRWYYTPGWVTYQYHIDVSNDASTWTTVATDTSNQLRQDTIDLTSTTAQYVRVTVTSDINGTQPASIYDVEVYGQ